MIKTYELSSERPSDVELAVRANRDLSLWVHNSLNGKKASDMHLLNLLNSYGGCIVVDNLKVYVEIEPKERLNLQKLKKKYPSAYSECVEIEKIEKIKRELINE